MRAAVLAAAALAACLAPGAHAASDSTYAGECSFAAATDNVSGQGRMAGEIDVEMVVYSPTPEANPVWATVTCYIKVNGVAQPGAVITASGAVAVVGAGAITYVSENAYDVVELCTRVDYTGPGDATPTSDVCEASFTIELPPPHGDPFLWIDYVLCEELTKIPGAYGPVVIDEEGDISIAGEPFWNCPPYDVVRP